uniref:Uncharacterized protein n=1 Tax=Timema poppense TaxID=170557 RepID=A0A7R9D9Y3_TIMPO|nr:unnamed protein product [Timema poppensis]
MIRTSSFSSSTVQVYGESDALKHEANELDINECEEGLDNCDQNTQLCINKEGSFHCEIQGGVTQCPAGYKINKEQRKCEDVDECKENLHSCMDETEICRNNIGAYECDIKCKAGFLYDNELRSCVDVDECREGLHSCEDNEDCFNEEGSYRCEQKQRNNEKCPLGYSYSADRKACLDVNECLTDQHNCTTASGEICVNIQGSFLCQMRSCPQGFTFNTRLTICDDVDECVTGQHNCSASEGLECVNLIGSFQCKLVSCREGFRLNTITSQCEDLDECELNTANCSPGEKCINEIGGFWCNPLCGSGYKINPVDSASCLDIDECQEGIDNCIKKTNICKNTDGGFVCEALPQCLPGFKLNSNKCEDIDECAENLHRCNTNSQLCVNTVGSYHCRTSYRPPQRHCARGFQIDQQTNVCVDVNECERGEYYCRDEEECVNSPGSYRCMITSNNVVPGEQCPAGFRYNHTRTQCFDIDECFEKIHVCNLESEACINEPGGYRCGSKPGQDKKPTTEAQKCPPGFREHPVTKSCVGKLHLLGSHMFTKN